MTRCDFLLETCRTERLKTLFAWSQVSSDRVRQRLEPRAGTPLEHMVRQCLSEDGWVRTMLATDVGRDPLPGTGTARVTERPGGDER